MFQCNKIILGVKGHRENHWSVEIIWGPFLESPEKPFVKLRTAYSVRLVFSYIVKGIKIKITAKFRASRRLRFEDTKRIMAPEIRPKSFGTFEKQAPAPQTGDMFCIVQIVSFNEIFVFNIKGPSQPVCFAGVESCGSHFHLYRNCSSRSPSYF